MAAGAGSEEFVIAVAVDRDKVLQAAQKLVEKKRYDKAVVEYQKLVADDPKDVRTLLKIGDLYLKMEQHVEAITTYERVGQFYSMQGFALKSIAVYKQIREIVHKHVPHMEDRFGHIVPRLAEIYTQLGLTSDALAAYDEVATRFQRAGRDRDAIDIFKKIVDLDPQNPLPYLRLAEAFVRVKDVDNAIQRFGSAAEILLSLGRRDDALKVVERLLQHRQDPKFARTAAEIYLERGQPSDAMAALTKLQISFKDNPKDLDTLALLARAFHKLGQPAKAIEVQKEAARIAKEANQPQVFGALVDALMAAAPHDEGVRALAAQRAAMAAPPQSAMPLDGRASIDVEVDEEVLLEDESEPAQSEAPFALRPSYGNIQMPPQVGPQKPAAPAAPAAPVDPALRARRYIAESETHRRNKDYDAAVALLVEAIEEIPSSRDLREKLCDLLIEAGDQAEAVRQMLGFAHWMHSQGDTEGAARLLDEVLLLEPDQPDAIAMLRDLGYAIEGASGPEYAAPEQPAAGFPAPAGADPYDPNAPLPSYDLEEISAVEALSHRPSPSYAVPPPQPSYPAGPRPFVPAELDDPFAADAPLPSFAGPLDAPLPSFPMEEEATTFMQLPGYDAAAYEAPPSPLPPRDSTEVVRPSLLPRPSDGGAQFDEEALEEVEFFASHGMFEPPAPPGAQARDRRARRRGHGRRQRHPRRPPQQRARGRPQLRHRRLARRARRARRRPAARGPGPRDGPDQRRVRLRAVQGRRGRADLRVRRGHALRSRRGVQGDGPLPRRHRRVRAQRARPEPGLRLPVDDRDDPPPARQRRRRGRRLHPRPARLREDARSRAEADVRNRRRVRAPPRPRAGGLLLPARAADRRRLRRSARQRRRARAPARPGDPQGRRPRRRRRRRGRGRLRRRARRPPGRREAAMKRGLTLAARAAR
jgi:tetratricopeptide (TPR) repeat protein